MLGVIENREGDFGVPGSRLYFLHRTTRPHMNDPRTILDRHAADIAVEATITNSANPLLGRPSLIGSGGLGLLISCKI